MATQTWSTMANQKNNKENGGNKNNDKKNKRVVSESSSSTTLTEALECLLAQGSYFAIVPQHLSNGEYIMAVEQACQRLNHGEEDELRAENYRGTETLSSLTSAERKEKALKDLREDRYRFILTGDKRVAMLVMDKKRVYAQS